MVEDANNSLRAGNGTADEPAADAFALVGNEHRVAILRALLDAHADPETAYPTPFAALRERAGVDVSSQFAYHLDELVGPFVARTGEGYRLRYAGWKAAAALAAGTYADQPAFGPAAVEGACPHCGREALHASYGDAWLTVACHGCERVLTRYPFPPGAAADRDVDALLRAFDRRVRSHFSLAVDGVCPECAGAMRAALATVDRGSVNETRGDGHDVQAVADCDQCGNHLTLPVGCVLLDDPAVLAWCRDHDVAVDDRPFWRVPFLVADDAVARTGTDPLEATVTIVEYDDVEEDDDCDAAASAADDGDSPSVDVIVTADLDVHVPGDS